MTYETAGRPTAALVVSGANVVRCADRTATLGRMGTEITRINPEELHPTPGYHHVTVVQAARMVFLAGQCPLDRDGSLVGPGDLEAQLDQVVANVLEP
jgi:enamine deaminase RidA (YjgF/YER057c/UK114 family)